MNPIFLCSILGLWGAASASPLDWNQQVFTAPTCPIDSPLSCSGAKSSCCHENALFLSTQFWNYYPAIGDNDTFTLHGLWPDNCDGSYEQFCDDSMNVKNVTQILLDYSEHELLSKMQKNWLNINHDDESLWLHEYNKHGTCVSSIKNSCYTGYRKDQNVVDFMNVTVNLYEKLPTFDWLVKHGIVPSTEKSYTKQEVENALRAEFGAVPFVKCNRFNGIQEIWYFHHSRGSILSEQFVPMDSLLRGNCPETGVKFFPKGALGQPKPQPPNKGTYRGTIKLTNQDGCLIRSGDWYIGGQCASYFAKKAPFGGYNVNSRAGPCGLINNKFTCGKRVEPMQFQWDKNTGYLSLNGKNTWSGAKVPKKYEKVSVYLGKGSVNFHLKFETL